MLLTGHLPKSKSCRKLVRPESRPPIFRPFRRTLIQLITVSPELPIGHLRLKARLLPLHQHHPGSCLPIQLPYELREMWVSPLTTTRLQALGVSRW
jgi:hypothetical protein